MTTNETLGQRIKALRKKAKLTQSGLGELVGVKRACVYLWETDHTTPTYFNLHQLANHLSVTTHYLETGETEPDHTSEETLGDRIRHKRLQKMMNQSELADFIDVRRAQLSQWEKGEIAPSGANLYKLSLALDADMSYLQAGDQAGQQTMNETIIDDLSTDALKIVKHVAKVDKEDRTQIRVMRKLLDI